MWLPRLPFIRQDYLLVGYQVESNKLCLQLTYECSWFQGTTAEDVVRGVTIREGTVKSDHQAEGRLP